MSFHTDRRFHAHLNRAPQPTLTEKLNDPDGWDVDGLIDDVIADLDSVGADDAIELITWLRRQLDEV